MGGEVPGWVGRCGDGWGGAGLGGVAGGLPRAHLLRELLWVLSCVQRSWDASWLIFPFFLKKKKLAQISHWLRRSWDLTCARGGVTSGKELPDPESQGDTFHSVADRTHSTPHALRPPGHLLAVTVQVWAAHSARRRTLKATFFF